MPELHQLCERVSKVEADVAEHRQKMSEFHTSLMDNTAMTKKGVELAERSIAINQTTADNTSELVELAKFFKYFQKFVIWTVSIVAPIWALIEVIRNHK